MGKIRNKFLYDKKTWYVLLLIFLGVFVRVIRFGTTPCGFNQDEAFAGYEAFSLLNYGIDAAGYRNPCYFVAWGSGMNVLESYLAIPFMKLFGCSVITLRLPQLIFSCISLPVFYLLMKKMFSYETALLGVGLLAISPWHIMMSRWGLESNLAPAFLLFGFYFFIKGRENNKYWLLSAVMYGISLYSYSITWIVVPLTVFFCGIYLIYTKQKISVPYVLFSGAILFLFALPFILFMLVNKGIIPEISTSFFSVPKMLVMRSSEVSPKKLLSPEAYYNFLKIFINQSDEFLWSSTVDFGLFYKFSLPFIVLGVVKAASTAFEKIKKRVFCFEGLILLGMFCSVVTCIMLTNLTVNKANSCHFYTLMFLTLGIKEVFAIFKKYSIVPKAVVCGYALMFVFFSSFYFSGYNKQISYDFRNGLGEAVEFVKEQEYPSVCLDKSIYFSQVLFYDQTPTDLFLDTVEYYDYPAEFVSVKCFGRYEYPQDYEKLDADKAYIIRNETAELFSSKGYEIKNFENYSVAYIKK